MGGIGRIIMFVAFMLCAVPVAAQTGTPSSQLAWDQPAQTLAAAQALTFGYYPDAVTTRTALTGVTCAGTTAPFQCAVAFPAFTPGNHTLTISASNVAGESGKSTVLTFAFVVVPGTPTNPHIVGFHQIAPRDVDDAQ